MSRYLEFVQVHDTGKTKVWRVRTRLHGESLGGIEWYGPWRQYVFCPESGTIFNPECMTDIISFIGAAMHDRRRLVP